MIEKYPEQPYLDRQNEAIEKYKAEILSGGVGQIGSDNFPSDYGDLVDGQQQEINDIKQEQSWQ